MGLSEKILAQPRSSTPSSSFWLSHIARYAPEPARRNLAHCCDPDVNKFCGMGSKSRIMDFMMDNSTEEKSDLS